MLKEMSKLGHPLTSWRFCLSITVHSRIVLLCAKHYRTGRTSFVNVVEKHTDVTPHIMVYEAIEFDQETFTAQNYISDNLHLDVLLLLRQQPDSLSTG